MQEQFELRLAARYSLLLKDDEAEFDRDPLLSDSRPLLGPSGRRCAHPHPRSSISTRGVFIGGASDNPNITDKEAGMLSREAYLSLYDAHQQSQVAGARQSRRGLRRKLDLDLERADPARRGRHKLHYKKGLSGGANEYLDWAVPSYAKLYKLTEDQHYLEVARVLLHDTKFMVALAGRQYDVRGIGWQQEGWRMEPGASRAAGGHRFWLPWVSANHLYGIVGLEEYDPKLYKQLSTKPAAAQTVKRSYFN